MLFEVGQELLTQVRQEIGGEGKVAGWQDIHMAAKAAMWLSGPGQRSIRLRKAESGTLWAM